LCYRICFFAYCYLNKTTLDFFTSRANKFEADLVIALKKNHESFVLESDNLFFLSMVHKDILIYEQSILHYSILLEQYDLEEHYLSYESFIKVTLSDFLILKKAQITATQLAFLHKIVYPLIFSVRLRSCALLAPRPTSRLSRKQTCYGLTQIISGYKTSYIRLS